MPDDDFSQDLAPDASDADADLSPEPEITFWAPTRPPEVSTFSHAGLQQLDPWVTPRPWYRVIWPWGLSGVIEVTEMVALALIMFIGVRTIAHNYVVEGGSMLPTFHDGDFVIVNRMAYRTIDLTWLPGVDEPWQPFGQPQAGDIIVFAYQLQPTERDFIKRVIAVPGQTVEVRDGRVHVDGVAIDEPYIEGAPNYTYPPTVVPPGKLFLLGDNRNNSFDSHQFGLVDQDVVIGRADIRYWPFDRFWRVQHALGSAVDGATSAVSRGAAVMEAGLIWR